MKEIKFEYILKSWKKIKKEKFTLEELEDISVWDFIYELNLDWDDFEIIARRQYTWLKDKNWKEIYFWDLIEHQAFIYEVVWNYDHIWFKQIKVVDWVDKSIYTDWWECLKQDYWKYFKIKNLFNFDSCKIIWNIYETLIDN